MKRERILPRRGGGIPSFAATRIHSHTPGLGFRDRKPGTLGYPGVPLGSLEPQGIPQGINLGYPEVPQSLWGTPGYPWVTRAPRDHGVPEVPWGTPRYLPIGVPRGGPASAPLPKIRATKHFERTTATFCIFSLEMFGYLHVFPSSLVSCPMAKHSALWQPLGSTFCMVYLYS